MIRIGSRGSQLALWQANHVAEALRAWGHEVGVQVIRTTGDRMQHISFAKVGAKGMFTKEIEEALLDRSIDLAVHSLKDLPTDLGPPFALAAIPPRADARDAFLSVQYESFAALPPGARVGTSSRRRQAQLRAARHDVEFIEFRGNVDTRLRKLRDGEVDGIVLASAGLDRLSLTELVRERFSPLVLCPAAGQGALAIETREDDAATIQALHPLDDEKTRFAVTAERAALGALGGGCQVPIGIYCAASAQGWEAMAAVGRVDGSMVLREALTRQHGTDAKELGHRLAAKLIEQGAAALLEGEGE